MRPGIAVVVTPSKFVSEGRDEADKGVAYKQELGVVLELERHQVAGQRAVMAPKPGGHM